MHVGKNRNGKEKKRNLVWSVEHKYGTVIPKQQCTRHFFYLVFDAILEF